MAAGSEPLVVNTGPLIALSACGNLDLLERLHSPVIVPAVVMTEFQRGPAGMVPGAILRPSWIHVRPNASPPPASLVHQLDPGEAAVISLALERSVALVAIDERRGRLVARAHGLRVVGSIGILLRAKRQGLVPALRPCIEKMRAAEVWLSDRLCSSALREAGEE